MNLGKEFSEYKLDNQIISALNKLGFARCTPIQDQAIPLVISGQDVAGLAQTGTGKTAAFLLPLIERVLRSVNPPEDEELKARAFLDWKPTHFNLVLVPTRELAEQVKDCAMDFLKDTPHRVVTVYGGVSIEKQIEQLNKGFTFLIATPGRLIDLYKEHKVDLKQVRSVTFDEADRMFDMGFKDDMKYILHRIPEKRQLLLFSATLNLDVFNVAYQFGANPVEIKVSQDQMTADNVDDRIFHLGNGEKPSHLLGLIDKLKPRQVIIFTNFKNQVERIAEFLNKNNHKAAGISSLMSQSQRQRVMTRFREEGGENILVATDVAARGLDIQGVDLVINFELPDDAENYVHRIGRTGRAGEKGKAFSFVSDKDVEALDRIQKYINRTLPSEWMEDVDLPKDFAPMPKGELLSKQNRSKAGGSAPRDFKNKRRDFKSRDGKPRPEGRSGERNERRPRQEGRKPHEAGATPTARSPRDEQNKQVHRDKRSGRHKHSENGNGQNRKNFKQNDRTNSTSNNNRSRNKKFVQKRPNSGTQQSQGLLTKITSAFRSLFK